MATGTPGNLRGTTEPVTFETMAPALVDNGGAKPEGAAHTLSRDAISRGADHPGDLRPAETPRDAPTISGDEVRRLTVLAKVAETVTADFSLDHQLPHLIQLIADALDAERATLFLHDKETGTLFSRVLQGEGVVAEIRIRDSTGISGAVFQSGTPEIVADAYDDPRFNHAIDLQTGYRTHGILCVPLRNRRHEIIGVTQVLNKRTEGFRSADLELAEAINRHASSALEQAMLVERLVQARREETELLPAAEAVSPE